MSKNNSTTTEASEPINEVNTGYLWGSDGPTSSFLLELAIRDSHVVMRTEYLLLLMLAKRTNEKTYTDEYKPSCYPSYWQLTRDCGLKERALRRAAAVLIKMGLIHRGHRDGCSNTWTLNGPRIWALARIARDKDEAEKAARYAAREAENAVFEAGESNPPTASAKLVSSQAPSSGKTVACSDEALTSDGTPAGDLAVQFFTSLDYPVRHRVEAQKTWAARFSSLLTKKKLKPDDTMKMIIWAVEKDSTLSRRFFKASDDSDPMDYLTTEIEFVLKCWGGYKGKNGMWGNSDPGDEVDHDHDGFQTDEEIAEDKKPWNKPRRNKPCVTLSGHWSTPTILRMTRMEITCENLER